MNNNQTPNEKKSISWITLVLNAGISILLIVVALLIQDCYDRRIRLTVRLRPWDDIKYASNAPNPFNPNAPGIIEAIGIPADTTPFIIIKNDSKIPVNHR